MPFASEALVAGPYTCTWNGAALGIFQGEEDIPTIAVTPRAKPINSSDRWGMTRIDSVHMGFEAIFQGVLMEYAKALPVLGVFGTFGLDLGLTGVLKYSLAQALVLTAIAGTTAATAPATLTANKAIIGDEFQAMLKFGPALRTVPIKMDLYPYQTAVGPPIKYGFFIMT